MSAIYLREDLKWDYMQFQNQARLQYETINDYFKHFDRFLKDKEERIKKASEGGKLVAEIPVGDDMAELVNNLVEWSQANAAKIVYNSLFWNSNSYLEWGLIEVCCLASIYIGDDFLLYTKGKGLEKAKNYLKEKLNVSINAGSKEWYRFTVNQEIRNLMIHNGANIVVDYSKNVDEQPVHKNIKPIEKEFYRAFLITKTGFIYIKDVNYIQESHKWGIEFVQQTLDAAINGLRNRGIKWA
jgi:hypothetical protein